MGDGFSGEQADSGVMAAFRQVVADFQAVFPAAKFACCLRREIVREAQKDLCTKSLEQTSPTVPGKRGTQGADALCSDDRNAFGLPGEAEELFVASRIALADRCEVLVFIAEEEDLAKMPILFRFNLRDGHYSLLRVRLHMDGKELLRKAPFVFVGNNQYEMEGLNIGGRRKLDAGELCLFVANRAGRLDLVRLAFLALFGRLNKATDLDVLTSKQFESLWKKKHIYRQLLLVSHCNNQEGSQPRNCHSHSDRTHSGGERNNGVTTRLFRKAHIVEICNLFPRCERILLRSSITSLSLRQTRLCPPSGVICRSSRGALFPSLCSPG